MRILTLSGSLRRESSNTNLLRAAALIARGISSEIAPDGVEIFLYDNLGDLPHFNPDVEGEGREPSVVLDFRAQIAAADALLISTPEYAHGVPGVLKNALDWMVGSGELVEKPVALLNASPRSVYAVASLTETLTVMMARIVPEASVTLARLDKSLDAAGIAADPEVGSALRAGLTALRDSLHNNVVTIRTATSTS